MKLLSVIVLLTAMASPAIAAQVPTPPVAKKCELGGNKAPRVAQTTTTSKGTEQTLKAN